MLRPRVGDPAPAGVRLHRGGAADPAHADGHRRRPSRSARWAPTPRWRRCRRSRGCSSTTSPSCSRRSPTRRWTRSARSWSPRVGATIGPEGNLLDPGPASCRQVVLPRPGHRQRRAGQDLAHQRRRRHAGAGLLADRRPLPRPRRRRGPDRRARTGAPRMHRGRRRRRPAADPVRPQLRRRPRADPGAAADRGRAQPPGPHRPPHPGRPGHRDRRVPRGASPRAADRVRRGRGQPLPRVRVDRGPRRHRRDQRHHRRARPSPTT